MKLDLRPFRSTYVAPTFGDEELAPLDPALEQRLRRPMVVGAAVIGALVVGLGLWATFTPLATGITAPGEVTVEANRKTLRRKETGTVRQILVKEGQLVRANQTLLVFDDTEARAQVAVLQNQADSLMSQAARLAAEATDRPSIAFPPELTSRSADPAVAAMMRDQEFLFNSRLQLFQSQSSVLQQRFEQIQNQIQGAQAQLDSIEEQRKLTLEEMAGYETLYEKGFAPKQLILRYKRQVSDLGGRKGSLLADIARLRQQTGETKMQLASLRDQRQSQAAEQLRDTQSKVADVLPRLTAARSTLDGTVVRAPTDGYVFNLTQFTVGGVAGAGELLMDIVPSNSPLMVSASVKPQDIEQVRVGMDAQVRLIESNPRGGKPLPAKVMLVSADRVTNDKTGAAFYRVGLRIDPKDLRELERKSKITPGMAAAAMIVTGKRTVMGYLVQPITDTLRHALREP